MPDAVSKKLADALKLQRVLVGQNGEVENDAALQQREANRQVKPELWEIKKGRTEKDLDFAPLDNLLCEEGQGKRIYFANTVDRLQATYDRLVKSGVDAARISVLHNRMPHAWRKQTEEQVNARFGKDSAAGDWILLTNQVAEAGLDISAPLVITDAAPVDTLVQRAGRCARWFREGVTEGRFIVLKVPGLKEQNPSDIAKQFVRPYRYNLVFSAIKFFPAADQFLTWESERQWINQAWGGGEEKALAAIDAALNNTTFALNLFDRAAQERKPGEIARVFREVLSVEVAVEKGDEVRIDDLAERDLQPLLDKGQLPDTSSISLGKAYGLVKQSEGRAAVIRYDREENQLLIRKPDGVQLGDILLLPSSVAYLHRQKGLCFDDNRDDDAILSSEWAVPLKSQHILTPGLQHYQTLAEHSLKVMVGTFRRFDDANSPYRKALLKILRRLENITDEKRLETLADLPNRDPFPRHHL